MQPERWQQIDRLLDEALELAPEQRAAFLDRACAGDDSLRKEVESLLAHDERISGFIAAPALAEATALSINSQIEGGSPPKKKIGSYKVLRSIGSGGMGDVYLAVDQRLGRKVALKLLRTDLTCNQDRLRRFQQEARAASALNHPNILTIYEIGESGATHFIATELVEGETIRSRMNRSRMSLPEALDVACQVTDALAAAHKAGIIHRDIKPENIMIRDDGYVKLLDFGLAKLSERPDSVDLDAQTVPLVNTDTGVVIGTPSYMSPEQVRGIHVDARTDIFSLGVTLYEMAAGRPPFEAETVGDLVVAVLQKEPAPLAPNAPSELQRILTKALRKNREERYQTVAELANDLRHLKREIDPRLSNLSPAFTRGITAPTDARLESAERATLVGDGARTTIVSSGEQVTGLEGQSPDGLSLKASRAGFSNRLTGVKTRYAGLA
ncbi:MAG: serine/threonine-protein kinase, partial [Blastocatellia bacterium]